MTVRELINKLLELPNQDAQVFGDFDGERGWSEPGRVSGVWAHIVGPTHYPVVLQSEVGVGNPYVWIQTEEIE